jgi:hypothetical protein
VRFAKIVFTIAGIWGIIVLTPLYFVFDTMGRLAPPAINHPQYYYGFVSIGLVWQIAFLIIASDPLRFRPFILAAILEKFGYMFSLIVLALQRRISNFDAVPAIPDGILGVLFIAAFFATGAASRKGR